MKIFITKYALTTGITEAEAEDCNLEGMVVIRATYTSMTTYYSPRDYTLTLTEAVERAEKMRTAKLLSLHKQEIKLRKIDFNRVSKETQ